MPEGSQQKAEGSPDSAITVFEQELSAAARTFPKFRSFHEGLAVLEEEVHELRMLVYAKDRSPAAIEQMRKEAAQVAAMAMRFIYDLCS